MLLYSVRSADSVYSLSKKFGVDTADIVGINALGAYPYLVIGQQLLIPANENNSDISDAIKIQPASANAMPLRIYADYDRTDSFFCMQNQMPGIMLSDNYKADIEGDTVVVTGMYDGKPDMFPVMCVMCHDTAVSESILASENNRQKLINKILNTIHGLGYRELLIEGFWVDARLTVKLLSSVMTALKPFGIPVSYVVEPKDWHGSCSYPKVGIVDYIILKTYDIGRPDDSPGAVSPFSIVKEIAEYAAQVFPKSKLVLGLALYGYDWTLPFIYREPTKKELSFSRILASVARQGANIQFDKKTLSPFSEYRDEQQVCHIAWFEDALSLYIKLRLVSGLNIAGFHLKFIKFDFPQILHMINHIYNHGAV